MRFDAIIVPCGAEARAVRQGWLPPRPEFFTVPAGSTAGVGLMDNFSATTVLVLGLCGALDPTLRVGSRAVYSRIISGAQSFLLDPELSAVCAAACCSLLLDACDVEHVVSVATEKSTLRAATGAAVIDMEGASIARALQRRGMRVAMVRVVSDDALTDLPAMNGIYDAYGRLRPLALGAVFVRQPLPSARFIRNALAGLRSLRATARLLSLDSAR